MVVLAFVLRAGMCLVSRAPRLVCLALLVLSVGAARAQDAVPRVSGSLWVRVDAPADSGAIGGLPKVTGPLLAVPAGDPSHNYPFDASLVPVSDYGYTEKEYFFSGDTSEGSYTSRMLVRRPADPARFSGTVIVEWANVSPNFEVDLLWEQSAADIMRSGDAYVLVSAEPEGVYQPKTGLKAWNAQRYAPLSIPQPSSSLQNPRSSVEDPSSFEIFGQALRAIRSSAGGAPLDGLQAEHVIATGGSESAVMVMTYASQDGSAYGGVDGYLLWDLSSSSPGLDSPDKPADAKTFPSPTGAAGPPVLWINTESDAARTHTTPDGPEYRLWEVAGTTHVDIDLWNYYAAIERRDLSADPPMPDCTYRPFSRIPMDYALDAGIADLTAWIRTGTPPRSQPSLLYDAQGNVVRDAYGNARGGVRLPDQTVPIAATGGDNSGSACSPYAGHSIPFSANVLRDLYPTHADYIADFNRAAQAAVKAGVMLPHDAQQDINAAAAADIPPAAPGVPPAARRVPPQSCGVRSTVSIRIPARLRGRRVLRATVSTHGHRTIGAHGGQHIRLVLQRGTPHPVTVRIALRLRGGKRVVQVRTYRMCR